jgi:hypothetical protein
MNKPDFFIVGAPKCGTTSLCKYLAQHPDVFISKFKEPNQFSYDLIEKPIKPRRSIEEYLEFFNDADGRICGEGSSLYLYSKIAAKEIYNFNPNAKIIIMLRNPVDFLYSYHNQCVLELDEDIRDFKRAIEAENDRKQGKRIPKDCTRPSLLFYSEVAKFTEQIQRYFDVFGQERVQIIIFDNFIKDTANVYQKTLRFLGIEQQTTPTEFTRYRTTSQVKHMALFRAYKRTIRTIFRAGRVFKFLPFSSHVQMFLHKIFVKIHKKFMVKKASRPPMDTELRQYLTKRFTSEVEQLSTLIGHDLTHWNRS